MKDKWHFAKLQVFHTSYTIQFNLYLYFSRFETKCNINEKLKKGKNLSIFKTLEF